MSVINQVLVELEKRRASGAERGLLSDHVRALPESGNDNRLWWSAAAGGAVLALAGVVSLALSGFSWGPRETVATVPPSTPETFVERVVSASTAVATDVTPREQVSDKAGSATRPVGRLSLELSTAPAPQNAAPFDSAQGRPFDSARGRAADDAQARPGVAREPIPSERVVGRTATPGIPKEQAKEQTRELAKEQARPPAAPAAVAEKPAPTGKPGIEKQVRQATARDLADNEYRKAAGSLHQGRLQEAMEGFRAALNLYPGHHGARQALVALLVEGKAGAEAERVLQEGVKLAPEQIGFAMTLARLQVDRGDGPGAVATLQASLGHAQASPDYAAFLAALLQRQGRHGEAIEQFQAALRAKPATGVWWLGLAISLQALNRGPEAQDAYRRAKTTNNLNAELTAFADQRLRQLQ